MQWGNRDNAANSVLWGVAVAGQKAPTAANRNAFFANTTVGAYVPGVAVGQEGVTVAEKASNPGAQHSGWNIRKAGTGSIETVTITGGAGYANSDTFVIAAPGGANATGNVVTNATGNTVGTRITSGGAGFTAKNPTVTITTAGGTGAVASAVAGGRAGRVQYETIVATGSLT